MVLSGCARPQGELFPPIDPPVVFPPPPETPRIKLIGILTSSADLHAGQPAGERFKAALRGPRPPIRFSGPQTVAVNGDLLGVADGTASAVHIVDLQQRTHRVITGAGDSRFGAPIGTAWVANRLFVADAARKQIIELDTQGAFRNRLGADVLVRPVAIVHVADRNQLYVVDGGAHRVIVFDPGGTVVTQFGRRGTAPGEFNYPTHIAWDGGDRLLVADTGNFRVQLLDLDGACVRVFGQKGDGAGDFALPKGVAFDSEGHLYVVDAHFENVQVFDKDGRLLLAFGREGYGPGEFWLPAGITIDSDDRIWVADAGNRRLQLFQYARTARRAVNNE